MNQKVKIKLAPCGKMPYRAHKYDAGADLYARDCTKKGNIEGFSLPKQVTYNLGVHFEIPQGKVGLIFPRSSIKNTGLSLSNSVGVLDSGFTGELSATFNVVDPRKPIYEVGDRVCQIVIVDCDLCEFEEVEELGESERGSKGFGSTGK